MLFRRQGKPMTSNEPGGPISDMLALATRTADTGNDLAIGAGQIIAKRVALGLAAAVNPMAADHAEFARMMPEKVEAFSAAGIAMFEQSELVGNQIARFASDEVMTTAQATIEMSTCFSPIAMLEAQSRFAHAWWDRATSNFMALAMMTLKAQARPSVHFSWRSQPIKNASPDRRLAPCEVHHSPPGSAAAQTKLSWSVVLERPLPKQSFHRHCRRGPRRLDQRKADGVM